MRKSIYKQPSRSFSFDWTFDYSSTVRSKTDCFTMNDLDPGQPPKQTYHQTEDYMTELKEDDRSKMRKRDEIHHLKHDALSKMDVVMFVVVNQFGFINEIYPQPGMLHARFQKKLNK